jgi:transposase
MPDYQKEIKESVQELQRLEKHQSRAILRDRIRFLRLLKSGQSATQRAASEAINLCLREGQRIWARYRSEGLQGLLRYSKANNHPKLTPAQRGLLQQRLAQDHIQTLREARELIQAQFGVHYSLGGVHYVFQCLNIKKKTGRPSSVRKDHQGSEAFKKNSPPS